MSMLAPMSTSASGSPHVSARADTELYGVYEISKLLSTPSSHEAMLSGVLALLSSFLDMRNGLIAVLEPDGTPDLVVGQGLSPKSARAAYDALPERVVGGLIATKMPIVVENMTTDPMFEGYDLGDIGQAGSAVAFVGVPIKDRNETVGTLTIHRPWTGVAPLRLDIDVRFLTMVANLVGQTIRLHRMIARDRERLMAEQRRLEKALEVRGTPIVRKPQIGGIVGESPELQRAMDKVRIVAQSHSTVLLRGESGTGKELFARALHDLSPRRDKPFVKLNCAALTESVLESELFGHEKGAFTGAINQRKGRFETADGGTLFLDEIGEISSSFQAKLLRVLQEGEFERVGASRTIKVDVRLVCATNRNLEDAVASGAFRADLYYRISVVPIFLPPLRERPGDVKILAREFLQRFNSENGTGLAINDEALGVLSHCQFPGNVRELENCVRRTATLARGDTLVANDLACRNDGCLSAVLWRGTGAAPSVSTLPGGFMPLPIAPTTSRAAPAAPVAADAGAAAPCGASVPCPVDRTDGKSERDRLIDVMETAGWVQAKAARLLGMTPRQVGYALRKHGIDIKKF